MITIAISEIDREFVDSYAIKQTIGGLSNLDPKDLGKSSREDFQKTGIYGELAHYSHRYGDYGRLKELLDYKFKTLRPKNIGDNGFDDLLEFKGKKRFIDIKTSHCEHESRIPSLNLVIPIRELHNRMIYVAAFAVGKDRRNVEKVILAGWCFTEDIKERWRYDDRKFCVSVGKLRPMKELELYYAG